MNEQYRTSSRSNRSSDFLVRIDSNNNGTFQGKIENIQSGQSQVFMSLLEMWNLIQQKLDEHQFPRKTEEFRSWRISADSDWNMGGKQNGN